MLDVAPSFRDIFKYLVHSLGSLATGKALPARFVFEKIHEIPGDVDHAGFLVHDDHSAGTHDRSGFDQAVVIDREIEHSLWNAPPRRPTRLNRFDRRFSDGPAPHVFNHFPDRNAHRHFNETRVLNLADKAEYLCAGVFLGADICEFLGA